MLHQKTISSNYNQNTNENWQKSEKTTPIGLGYVQFYGTKDIEVERGVEYKNYQREIAI